MQPDWLRDTPVPTTIGLAIQACFEGKASPSQQTDAMRFIVGALCGTDNETFIPDSERGSAFLAGKRSVGLKLRLIQSADFHEVMRGQIETRKAAESAAQSRAKRGGRK